MLDDWPRRFLGCEPIAHELREIFPDRWVRFHSLPGSKRYPETEDEYATVFERHNRVLAELAGPGYKVVLLTTGSSGTADVGTPRPKLRSLAPDAKLWRTLALHERDHASEPYYWGVFASEQDWRPGLFDPVVRLVADDVVANVMMVAPDCRWLLHPYDGGMDVILDSPVARDRLRGTHREWLSARPDGL